MERNGTPVDGLVDADFELGSWTLPTGGTAFEIEKIRGQMQEGKYGLYLIPQSGGSWVSGEYGVFLRVHRGSDVGHDVVKLVVP